MKIKNIKSYVESITNNTINESTKLMTKDDHLLTKLYGDQNKTTFKQTIKLLYSFASDDFAQVFYEFLQNAHDSGASGLWIKTFPGKGIIFINDGNPFHLNLDLEQKLEGSLFSFLGKTRSGKPGSNNKSGSKGMGSKLLYSLLNEKKDEKGSIQKSDRFYDTIVNKNIAPIMLSWYNASSLREFIGGEVNEFEQNEKGPIFIKLCFSYFPAVPLQKAIVNGKKIELFNSNEVDSFKTVLQDAYNSFKEDNIYFNTGSAIFIPTPDIVLEEIELEKEYFIQGYQFILDILKKNKSTISRIKFDDIELKDESIHEFKTEITLEKKTSSKASLYFSKSYNKKNLINAFTDFFPISHERYGLKYILAFKYFDINDNRQNLKGNAKELELILKGFEKDINSFMDNREAYLDLVLAIASSRFEINKSSQQGSYKELQQFHENFTNLINHNLPVFDPAEMRDLNEEFLVLLPKGFESINASMYSQNYASLNTDLQYRLNDLGLTSYGGLKIKSLSIAEFLENIKESGLKKLIEQNGGQIFYEILIQLASEISVQDIPFFTELEILPFENGYKSLEWLQNHQDYILLINREEPIRDHFPELKFSSSNILFYNALEKGKPLFDLISEEWSDKVQCERFVYLVNELDTTTEEQDLNAFEFANRLDKQLAKTQLEIFKNRRGDTKLNLRDLLSSERSLSSELIGNLRVCEDYKDKLDDYVSRAINDNKVLFKFLDSIQEELSLKKHTSEEEILEIQRFYTDISLLYRKAREKFGIQDYSLILESNGSFGLANEFRYENLTDQSLYSELVKLVGTHFNKALPHYKVLEELRRKPFRGDLEQDLINIEELNGKSFNLKEIKIIHKYFSYTKQDLFESMFIKESGDGSFVISKLTNDEFVFIGDTEKLFEVVRESGGLLLAEKIQRTLEIKDTSFGVHNINDINAYPFLIDKIGYVHELVVLAKHCNTYNKLNFLENISEYNLDIHPEEDFDLNGIFCSLLKLAYDINKLDLLSQKVTIQGVPLNTIQEDQFQYQGVDFAIKSLLEKNISSKELGWIKSKIPEDLSNESKVLFEVNENDPSEIYMELMTGFCLDQVDRIAFGILYARENEIPAEEIAGCIDFNSDLELLTYFSNNGINDFSEYFVATDLLNKDKIATNMRKLWLEEELFSTEVYKWSQQKKANLDFLKQHFEFQNDVKEIESIRSKFLKNEDAFDNNLEKNLNWAISQKVIIEKNNATKLINSIIESRSNVKSEFLVKILNIKEQGNETFTIVKNEGNAILIQGFKNENYKSFDTYNFDKEVIVPYSKYTLSKEEIDDIVSARINICRIRSSTSENGRREWDNLIYANWRNSKYNSRSYKVYIIEGPIVLQEVLISEEEQKPLKEVKKEDYFVKENQKKDESKIWINKNLFSNGLFSIKTDNADEIFKTSSQLKDFMRLREDYQNYKDNRLKDLGAINDDGEIIESNISKSADVTKEENIIDGNIHLEEITKSQRNVLERLWPELQEAIDVFGDELRKKLMEAISESVANALSGYVGEIMALAYYKSRGVDMKHVGDGVNEYDLESSKYSIEVKTKESSLFDESTLGSGSLAVYLRKSQITYLNDKQKRNQQYYLNVIGLSNLGINETYEKWKSQFRNDKEITEELKKEIYTFCVGFMADKSNREKFESSSLILNLSGSSFEELR